VGPKISFLYECLSHQAGELSLVGASLSSGGEDVSSVEKKIAGVARACAQRIGQDGSSNPHLNGSSKPHLNGSSKPHLRITSKRNAYQAS